jgi:chaperonin cofactor prefoldin
MMALVEIDIEEHLYEVDTQSLVDELESRHEDYDNEVKRILNRLWEAKYYGTPEKFDELFRNICDEHIGKAA